MVTKSENNLLKYVSPECEMLASLTFDAVCVNASYNGNGWENYDQDEI